MKYLAIIPARGGSKGLPGKNIRQLLGKPLIAWTIEHAFESECLKNHETSNVNDLQKIASNRDRRQRLYGRDTDK